MLDRILWFGLIEILVYRSNSQNKAGREGQCNGLNEIKSTPHAVTLKSRASVMLEGLSRWAPYKPPTILVFCSRPFWIYYFNGIRTDAAYGPLGIVNIINICVIYYVTSTRLKVLLGIYLIDWKSVMPNKYLWNWSYLFGLNPSRSINTYFIPPTWSLINNSRVFDEKNYSLKTRVQIIPNVHWKKNNPKKIRKFGPFLAKRQLLHFK